ncbi:hypoxanthine phosphoribosyltransferase [bacterium]|jgi:hypoxanthine phosphoribosyltransferase|nr:hypoxanthine phosphoribosyltransferase [bacterium]
MSKEKPAPVYHEPPVYISEADIKTRVRELAEKINDEFGNEEVTAICTLKGSVVYFSDLIRHLKMPVVCEFLGVSSYGNQTESTGEVKVTLDLNEPLNGRNVLLVEDIVDTGLTLGYLLDYLKAKKPAKIKTTAFLFKPQALKAKSLQIDYVGFEIPNRFVVGYGLDYAEKFRGLPYIGTLED